ncbi:MAG: Cyclomaltodextrinase, N-terminal, partial [Verrucomicrobiota bacterium]
MRLLIRGENLSGARVKAQRSQTVVSDLRVNRNGTYLFVNVRINSTATPGDYPLIVETAQGRTLVP